MDCTMPNRSRAARPRPFVPTVAEIEAARPVALCRELFGDTSIPPYDAPPSCETEAAEAALVSFARAALTAIQTIAHSRRRDIDRAALRLRFDLGGKSATLDSMIDRICRTARRVDCDDRPLRLLGQLPEWSVAAIADALLLLDELGGRIIAASRHYTGIPQAGAPRVVKVDGAGERAQTRPTQYIVDAVAQTIEHAGKVYRFGGDATWAAFVCLWDADGAAVDLGLRFGRDGRSIASDIRESLRRKGLGTLAEAVKSQRGNGYYIDRDALRH